MRGIPDCIDTSATRYKIVRETWPRPRVARLRSSLDPFPREEPGNDRDSAYSATGGISDAPGIAVPE